MGAPNGLHAAASGESARMLDARQQASPMLVLEPKPIKLMSGYADPQGTQDGGHTLTETRSLFPAGSVRAPSAPRLAHRPVPRLRRVSLTVPSRSRSARVRWPSLLEPIYTKPHDVFVRVRDLEEEINQENSTGDTGWMDPYLRACTNGAPIPVFFFLYGAAPPVACPTMICPARCHASAGRAVPHRR
jgi:hypothetical protein